MVSPKQTAQKKLDRIFSEFIRLRDTKEGYGHCCSCSKMILYAQGDAGHFINRRWMPTRWREDNVHLQCRSCNRFDEGNASGYTLFMIDKYSREHVEFLRALSKEYGGYSVIEIDLLTKDYKDKVKKFKLQ